jgi:TetR/AcrR family transcriptional regulator, transcriptional repressor for nem operon
MPRTKPPQERRTDLLDAAQSLVVEKGVAATTLDDVTRRAGVAKGTFYLYFRSKDDLVAALQERFATEMADRMAAAVAGTASWEGKLDACVRAMLADYEGTYELHDVLFHHNVAGADRHQGDHPAGAVPLVDVVRHLLAAGTEAGAFQVDDPDLTAVLLYSALHGAYDASCHGPQRPEEHELVAAAERLFRRAAGLT